jgi:lysophospholipase L1-like esterase
MGTKIVFFGDSITAGSKSESMPLGDGYVSMLAGKFLSDKTFMNLQVINSGVNGHTVQDLLGRFDEDVVKYSPDLVIIKIGINDAYNDFVENASPSRLDIYDQDYHKLIKSFQTALPDVRIALITPYYISDHGKEEFYQVMTQYTEIVKRIGKDYGLPVLDIQAVFDQARNEKSAQEWAADQIHPVSEGHMLIANSVFTFLKQGSNLLKR